jgi:hypothetical protein
MFASRLSGWDPNDNLYSTASSLSGPWSSWQLFAPQGSRTFSSQTTYILPVGQDTAIYMGDRWVGKNLMRSTYVWLPLHISGRKASLENYAHWSLDSATGSWTPGAKLEISYEAEAAVLSGGARVMSCSGCSGGKVAGYIGGPSNGSVLFSSIKSNGGGRRTVRIMYANGDKTQRFAEVAVNAGAGQRVAFLPSNDGATSATSVVHLDMREGINSIRISAAEHNWGPDLDRVIIS